MSTFSFGAWIRSEFSPAAMKTSGPEADLTEILGAPLVFVAAGLNSDRIHAPNEKVDMAMLLKGAEAVAYLWDELAEVSLSTGPR